MNHIELYKEILRHVEVAIKELGIASSLVPMEDTSAHSLTKVIDAFEDRLHVLTHENASAIALDLEDVKKRLAALEVMMGFGQFSQEEIEQIVKETWSVELVKKIHASMKQRVNVSLEEISADIKKLKQHWPH